jgi:glycosyltransferase involved in cell wall biosynthesis
MPKAEKASLVLTVLNEEAGLPSFFASVETQTSLPSDIVVVDGGSSDRTAAMFSEWRLPPGFTVKVITREGANISEGRNIAIANAQHDRILVTDAGTRLDPHWAERMLMAFDRPTNPDVIGGFFEPAGESLVERTIAFTVTPREDEIRREDFLPSSRSLGVTRRAWIQAGGYPEWLDYCEDLLFDLAMKEQGRHFEFVPDARVTWSARPTISAFMKQYFRYARGDGKASLWAKRHIARYTAYVLGFVFLGFSIWQPLFLLPLAVGVLAYMRKFWARVWRGRGSFGNRLAAGLILVPVVVVAGDLAKMAGYPVGLRWKRKSRLRTPA